MGFCRTNLSSDWKAAGMPFIQSVERHILRNFIFLHAIENGLPADRHPGRRTARHPRQ